MPKKQTTFEDYLQQLEETAEKLESGDLPLDEALKEYEKAIKAFRICQQMLKDAEQRIEVLLRDAGGKLVAKPFQAEEGAAPDADAQDQGGEADGAADEDTGNDLFA